MIVQISPHLRKPSIEPWTLILIVDSDSEQWSPTNSSKSIPIADKGTVIRAAFYKQYAEKIDSVYE